MAELTTVARPYGEAVFRAAVESGSVAAFGDALAVLGATAANPQAAALLGNPNVTVAEKAAVLSAPAGTLAAPVANLLTMLIESGKALLLPFIAEHFAKLQREHEGIVKATITSAMALSDADEAGLVEALGRKYGKRVEAVVVVDAELIGGARVQVGDDVIHASVRDTLDQMKQALTA
jgi:F-type H+-transporting ATPase subunit delta